MFTSFIQESFQDYKELDVNEAKAKFGIIWAAFASKIVRTTDGDIHLGWRELSMKLADIFNDWFNVRFTTDAFLKSYDHRTSTGSDAEYDEVINKITEHKKCLGIFVTQQPKLVRSGTVTMGVSETNILTGEVVYFRQDWNNGKLLKSTKVGNDEYEKICFGE